MPSWSAFVQILKNIIDPAAANDAVLSQYSCRHFQNLAASYPPPFNQPYDYLQIAHCVRIDTAMVQRGILLLMSQCRLCPGIPSFAVLYPLLDLAFFRLVVLDTAPV
jgi:hypothetical protein